MHPSVNGCQNISVIFWIIPDSKVDISQPFLVNTNPMGFATNFTTNSFVRKPKQSANNDVPEHSENLLNVRFRISYFMEFEKFVKFHL